MRAFELPYGALLRLKYDGMCHDCKRGNTDGGYVKAIMDFETTDIYLVPAYAEMVLVNGRWEQ